LNIVPPGPAGPGCVRVKVDSGGRTCFGVVRPAWPIRRSEPTTAKLKILHRACHEDSEPAEPRKSVQPIVLSSTATRAVTNPHRDGHILATATLFTCQSASISTEPSASTRMRLQRSRNCTTCLAPVNCNSGANTRFLSL